MAINVELLLSLGLSFCIFRLLFSHGQRVEKRARINTDGYGHGLEKYIGTGDGVGTVQQFTGIPPVRISRIRPVGDSGSYYKLKENSTKVNKSNIITDNLNE